MGIKFSSRVQMLIQFSREEAIRLGHYYIATEHLLLGLIRDEENGAVRILRNLSVELNELKRAVEDSVESTAQIKVVDNIPFTKLAEKILKIAYVEAEKYGSHIIGTEHLLLALTKEKAGVAAQVLLNFDITYEKVITELKIILRETSNATAKPEANSTKYDQTKQSQYTSDINSLFLSYRRVDSADVSGRIYDRLTYRFGREKIFKDVDSIPLGVDFRKYLDEMVGKCEILIAVIGNQWLTIQGSNGKRLIDNPHDFVRIEIESALKREIPVIPVLVQGTTMPSQNDLPFGLKELSYRNGIQVRPDPDFHTDMDRLIAGIEKHFKK